MRTLAIIIMMIFGMATLNGQTEKPGAWYTYNSNWVFNPNWSAKVLVQYRSQSIQPHLDKILLCGGLYYQKEQSPLKIGMYYYQLDNQQTRATNEGSHYMIYYHYSGQEVSYSTRWKGITLIPKIRLEQVWKPGIKMYQQSRWGMSFKIPLGKWALKGYNDTFIMISDLSYNRTRLYGGISRKVSNHLHLELGMMSERFNEYHKNYLMLQIVTKM